jgi:hypothetical protein
MEMKGKGKRERLAASTHSLILMMNMKIIYVFLTFRMRKSTMSITRNPATALKAMTAMTVTLHGNSIESEQNNWVSAIF